METLQGLLTAHPLFSDFPTRYLELVVGCASNVRFGAGEFIFHEGQEAEKFYLLREGKVALQITSERRGPLNILTLGEGDILGWSWLFPPYRWKFSARTIDPTRAFAMDGHCLRNKAEQDHDLGYELLKRFSRVFETRLETMRLQLVNVYEDK
ncbi:MAG TPA: cyclic nucleotide-binding domain-containing protein [Terriglobia bacterium]|jgi:CRP-like cAMP-binding protein|nr:cyclic nucleotide-binding domain-containing protein [Terriglobia bacterium]